MENPQIWTQEEEDELFYLIVEKKYSYQEAAKELGRSKKSVKCKWHRIKAKTSPQQLIAEENEEREVVFINKQVRAAKADLKKKSELKVYNALLRERAQKELVADKLVKSIQALPKLQPSILKVKPSKHSKAEEVAVLVLSDLHCGLVVKKEEICYLGTEYNMEIFRKRMKSLTESVISIIDLHRNLYPIKKLVICCLGDIVHGMNDAGQWGPLYLEEDVVTQIFECISEMEIMIAQYVQFFDNVEFYGVIGNHGRVARQGIEKDFVNWDYLSYKYLQQSLKNQDNLTFNYDKSWAQIATIQNEKFLLVHGDDMSGLGGMLAAESKYRGLFQHFRSSEEGIRILTPYLERLKRNPNSPELNKEIIEAAMLYSKSFDNMICGHIHNPNVLTTNCGGKIIVNGAFVGGDNYSIKKYQSMSKPTQKLFGVHKNGITWQYDIELDRN